MAVITRAYRQTEGQTVMLIVAKLRRFQAVQQTGASDLRGLQAPRTERNGRKNGQPKKNARRTKQSARADFALGSIWRVAVKNFLPSLSAPICQNMTSSTKPEVHNVLKCRQSRTEPQPQVTRVENFVKFGVRFLPRDAAMLARSWES